jgi:ribosome-interacting GTPase 1
LEAVGIRLNSKKPDVIFKQKAAGGITVGLVQKSH